MKYNENDFCSKHKIIFKKYCPQKFIEKGSFSTVYKGINKDDKTKVALKVENNKNKILLLENEAYILYNLNKIGIPKFYSYGKIKDYNILIEELLGNSLNDILKNFKPFNYKLVCSLGIQTLDILEYLHKQNYIHRDIKPANFLFGYENKDIFYLIDYGFACKFKSSKTGKHICYMKSRIFTGNLEFSSINALSQINSSRRDDLISLGYVLIKFLKNETKYFLYDEEETKRQLRNRILQKKLAESLEKLCEHLDGNILKFMKYVTKLEFEKEPDYDYLKGLLKTILVNQNIQTFDLFKNKMTFIEKRSNSRSRQSHKNLLNNITKSLEKKRAISNNRYDQDNISNIAKGEKNAPNFKTFSFIIEGKSKNLASRQSNKNFNKLNNKLSKESLGFHTLNYIDLDQLTFYFNKTNPLKSYTNINKKELKENKVYQSMQTDKRKNFKFFNGIQNQEYNLSKLNLRNIKIIKNYKINTDYKNKKNYYSNNICFIKNTSNKNHFMTLNQNANIFNRNQYEVHKYFPTENRNFKF